MMWGVRKYAEHVKYVQLGTPGAAEHIKYMQLGTPSAAEHVKYMQLGTPGAAGHVKYTQLDTPGAAGHVKYTQLGTPGAAGHAKMHTFGHIGSRSIPPNTRFFSKSTCFIVVHFCPFLLCFIRQMCATCQFYPVKWGAEDFRTTISPCTVLVRRSRQIGMFLSLFIDLNVKTRDSERANKHVKTRYF